MNLALARLPHADWPPESGMLRFRHFLGMGA